MASSADQAIVQDVTQSDGSEQDVLSSPTFEVCTKLVLVYYDRLEVNNKAVFITQLMHRQENSMNSILAATHEFRCPRRE